MNDGETMMRTETAAWLVAGHLNLLWSQWANATDTDVRGCCPECCGPCAALLDLLTRGELDALYGVWLDGGESAVWDAANSRIGREWLAEAWGYDMGCGHTTTIPA